MKACRLKLDIGILLETLGFKYPYGISVYKADVSHDLSGVELYLTGEHPDLSEVKEGEDIPEAVIICERLRSGLVVKK